MVVMITERVVRVKAVVRDFGAGTVMMVMNTFGIESNARGPGCTSSLSNRKEQKV